MEEREARRDVGGDREERRRPRQVVRRAVGAVRRLGVQRISQRALEAFDQNEHLLVGRLAVLGGARRAHVGVREVELGQVRALVGQLAPPPLAARVLAPPPLHDLEVHEEAAQNHHDGEEHVEHLDVELPALLHRRRERRRRRRGRWALRRERRRRLHRNSTAKLQEGFTPRVRSRWSPSSGDRASAPRASQPSARSAAQLTPAVLLQVASRRVNKAVLRFARPWICADASMLPVLIGGAFLVGAFIGAWWYRRRRTINISDSYGPMLG